MADIRSEISENPEGTRMSDVTADTVREEMAGLVRRSAEPVQAGESIKALIRRSATRLGLTFGRAKRYWYSEIRTVPAHEADKIRARAARILRERKQVQSMDNELNALMRRIEALEKAHAEMETVRCPDDVSSLEFDRPVSHRLGRSGD